LFEDANEAAETLIYLEGEDFHPGSCLDAAETLAGHFGFPTASGTVLLLEKLGVTTFDKPGRLRCSLACMALERRLRNDEAIPLWDGDPPTWALARLIIISPPDRHKQGDNMLLMRVLIYTGIWAGRVFVSRIHPGYVSKLPHLFGACGRFTKPVYTEFLPGMLAFIHLGIAKQKLDIQSIQVTGSLSKANRTLYNNRIKTVGGRGDK